MFDISHKKNNTKVDTNRYFITYADLITLLLGLFVILYVSSKVDQEKFKEYSKAFSEYFKTENQGVLPGGKGVLKGRKNTIPEPILIESGAPKSLNEIFSETSLILQKYIKNGSLSIKHTKAGVILTLPEKLLFQSGKADIEQNAMGILDTIANILHSIPYQITVDGHTDSSPIRTFRYESNWHLSSARALNVAYLLVEKGIPKNNLIIRAFGDQKPVASNNTVESKAKNRRVELTISYLPTDSQSTKGYKKVKENVNRK